MQRKPIVRRLGYCTSVVLSVLVFVTSACSAPWDRLGTPQITPISPAQTAGPSGTITGTLFSGQRAWETVQWLSETVGNRPAGSPAERRAAEEMAAQLKQWGYDAQIQTFPVTRFEDRGATLNVEGAQAMSLTVRALVNSTSGMARGRVVDAGLGRPQDFAGRDLRGAIALMQRGEIFFGQKIANAIQAGALGAIVYNNVPGLVRGMIPSESAIPAVALSQQDGSRLLDLARNQAITAELTTDTSIAEGVSQNVVATLPGPGDATLVLGAHLDSVPDAPGANDNASGAATVMELARAVSSTRLPYTLRVVLFGAEEIGLVGGEHYVRSLSTGERTHIIAMLNFDMVGVGDQLHAGGTESVTKLAVDIASRQSVRIDPLPQNAVGASDYAVFLDADVPAVLFYRSEDPRYHTADDQAEYVDARNLEVMGRLALQLLIELKVPVPV